MDQRLGTQRAGTALDGTIDITGVGWAFPIRPDVRGKIAMVRGADTIERSIRLILQTVKGERVMRPEFGSELYRLMFMPNDATTAGLARRYVQEALLRWEPRIELQEVNAVPDEDDTACLRIHIRYTIRATNSDRNLVFPFYTIPGED